MEPSKKVAYMVTCCELVYSMCHVVTSTAGTGPAGVIGAEASGSAGIS